MAEKFDRGSPVMIQTTTEKKNAFGVYEPYDPTTITISIYQQGQSEKISDAAMIKSATGQYYYICQTATNWEKGIYCAMIESSYGAYTDITINKSVFILE